jgi:hypothetical protein
MLSNHIVNAQSTLFNIPSTDVAAKQKTYVEFDFISHFESHSDGGFQGYVPRVVFGGREAYRDRDECCLSRYPGPRSADRKFQPNIKYQFYSNEKNGVAAAAGAMPTYTPHCVTGPGPIPSGCFTAASAKSGTATMGRGVTGGGYGLVGRADGTGTKGGAIAGYEQPIHPKGELRDGLVERPEPVWLSDAGLFFCSVEDERLVRRLQHRQLSAGRITRCLSTMGLLFEQWLSTKPRSGAHS